MHFQLTFRETCRKHCFYGNGFRLRPTVYQAVICIPAPWEVWVPTCHPNVEHIMHEQVSQDGTDHTALRSSTSSFDPCSILKLHRCCQPSFDVQQNPFALHMFADSTQQQRVVDVSNRPRISNSSTQSYFQQRSRVTPMASSADLLGR